MIPASATSNKINDFCSITYYAYALQNYERICLFTLYFPNYFVFANYIALLKLPFIGCCSTEALSPPPPPSSPLPPLPSSSSPPLPLSSSPPPVFECMLIILPCCRERKLLQPRGPSYSTTKLVLPSSAKLLLSLHTLILKATTFLCQTGAEWLLLETGAEPAPKE